MLISPAKIHACLSALLSSTSTSGPHTALLITPQGQLISAASIPEDEDENEGSGEGEEGDGVTETGGMIAEELYLDPPARLRLLLGLASQWNQGESPKMECELGRLHFTFLPLPPADAPSPIVLRDNLLPEVKPARIDKFLLVLNGRGTGWDVLSQKADEFRGHWKV
ncbi:hypothetical protein I308_104038 [Cryptococcus tetragattii IND107]|uniref:Late endosomal/lysosomal adaptor and MAPK and MTOR activator 5 n=1 Tax=Cryptococcus tetragattii IND107 TaxID=1296105 RepID=A0ABR3BP84_9TREE|nr:hypothetical protein I308_00624 [Cryptococcus tetragattii IND107]